MTALLLIALMAVAKALADTCQFHYDTSVFRGWNRNVWDNSDAWWTNTARVAPKRVFAYPLDAWHLSNSAMICLCLALPFCSHALHLQAGRLTVDVTGGVLYVLYGLWFNAVFSLFLNRIFRKKGA